MSIRPTQRGVFRSVDELKAAVNRFVTETNADPNPSFGLTTHAASSPLPNAGNRR
jgi:hypothetical protein